MLLLVRAGQGARETSLLALESLYTLQMNSEDSNGKWWAGNDHARCHFGARQKIHWVLLVVRYFPVALSQKLSSVFGIDHRDRAA